MFCGLGEERTKIRKKRKQKRKKPHRSQKWGGWDERVSFAVLKPFLTETAFYATLAGRFSGSKTKVL